MAGTVPITAAGLRRLKDELKHLKSVERGKITREIEVARAHGDLSENAEYHAAKEKQSHIEGRINYLEDQLSRAEVVDISKLSGDRVVFGATVVLEDVESGKDVTYRIVGELEADLKKRQISIVSPVARALVGKEVGDSCTVQSPGGPREYEIKAVRFEDDSPGTEPG
jgi:transcription elongation factor GreA